MKKNQTSVHQYITLLHENITVWNSYYFRIRIIILTFYVFVTKMDYTLVH